MKIMENDMYKDEAESLKELFNEKFNGLNTHINAQFKALDDKLYRIEVQTTKTNARVTHLESAVVDLEKKNLTHIVECPNVERIIDIENHQLELRVVKKWIVGSIAVASSLAGIIWVAVKLLEK